MLSVIMRLNPWKNSRGEDYFCLNNKQFISEEKLGGMSNLVCLYKDALSHDCEIGNCWELGYGKNTPSDRALFPCLLASLIRNN